MVMTILEAHVAPDKFGILRQVYGAGIKRLDPGLVQTFLIQSTNEPTLWRILSIWTDRDALNRMRQSGETPRGVVFFREAGAEPSLSIFDIAAQAAI